jgi:hypothetical protein
MTALRLLEDEGRLRRMPNRSWVLSGAPPETLDRQVAGVALGS